MCSCFSGFFFLCVLAFIAAIPSYSFFANSVRAALIAANFFHHVNLKWSQIVRTYLKGKGRLNYLLGTGPETNDPAFEAWDEEDSMIMSWLWDSLDPTISDTCMFLTTAKQIWDYIQRTYSKARDDAQVYEIKIKTGATKQGDKSVTEYANLLQNMWQELDHYRVIEMKCPDDAAILKNFIEKDRIYDFLAGL